MASLPYPLNRLNNHGRVGMAGMPYPPTDCRSYIKIKMSTYLSKSPHLLVNSYLVYSSTRILSTINIIYFF